MYRTINLQNERLLNLCTAVIPCIQAIRVGLVMILHALCVSALFCVKNMLALQLYYTSWMKTPCTELTCVSVVTIFRCLVKWFKKVKL